MDSETRNRLGPLRKRSDSYCGRHGMLPHSLTLTQPWRSRPLMVPSRPFWSGIGWDRLGNRTSTSRNVTSPNHHNFISSELATRHVKLPTAIYSSGSWNESVTWFHDCITFFDFMPAMSTVKWTSWIRQIQCQFNRCHFTLVDLPICLFHLLYFTLGTLLVLSR